MLKEKTRYDSGYYEWREYSKNCPWREEESCLVTCAMCMYTRCGVWHFLKKYKEFCKTVWEEEK